MLDKLDTGGGHIAVALFVFLVGVAMVSCHVTDGKEVMVGALASMWTALRTRSSNQQ